MPSITGFQKHHIIPQQLKGHDLIKGLILISMILKMLFIYLSQLITIRQEQSIVGLTLFIQKI
jgi:hypothetical protein